MSKWIINDSSMMIIENFRYIEHRTSSSSVSLSEWMRLSVWRTNDFSHEMISYDGLRNHQNIKNKCYFFINNQKICSLPIVMKSWQASMLTGVYRISFIDTKCHRFQLRWKAKEMVSKLLSSTLSKLPKRSIDHQCVSIIQLADKSVKWKSKADGSAIFAFTSSSHPYFVDLVTYPPFYFLSSFLYLSSSHFNFVNLIFRWTISCR